MFEKLKTTMKTRRGYLKIDTEKCTYCGICQTKCPAGAIVVCASGKEWHVDHEKCRLCSRCLRKCPRSALSIVKV